MIWIFWDWFKNWISFLSALLLNVQPNYTYKEDISNGRDVRMSLDVMLKHQSIIKCLKKFIQWVQTYSTLSLKNYLTLFFLGILNAYNYLPLSNINRRLQGSKYSSNIPAYHLETFQKLFINRAIWSHIFRDKQAIF